jgi:hypothetical protein
MNEIGESVMGITDAPADAGDLPPRQPPKMTYAFAIKSLVASVSGIRSCQSVAGEAVGQVAAERIKELLSIADNVKEKGNKYILETNYSNHYQVAKVMRTARKETEALTRLNRALFTD